MSDERFFLSLIAHMLRSVSVLPPPRRLMFSDGQVPSSYLIARGSNSCWQTPCTVSKKASCCSEILKSLYYVRAGWGVR
jgi:hypothetical protein